MLPTNVLAAGQLFTQPLHTLFENVLTLGQCDDVGAASRSAHVRSQSNSVTAGMVMGSVLDAE